MALKRVLFIIVCIMILVAPVAAHHSYSAEFDTAKSITFKGRVTMVEWGNPHIYTDVEAKNADGKPVVFRVEGSSPKALECTGWKKDTLKIGQTVNVSGFRPRNSLSPNVFGTITTSGGGVVYKVSESCASLEWPHYGLPGR